METTRRQFLIGGGAAALAARPESPVTMLGHADLLGRDAPRLPGGSGDRVPALRTHEFNLASISEAV